MVFSEGSWSVVIDLIHHTDHLCTLDWWDENCQAVSKGAFLSLLSSDYSVLMTTEQNNIEEA